MKKVVYNLIDKFNLISFEKNILVILILFYSYDQN